MRLKEELQEISKNKESELITNAKELLYEASYRKETSIHLAPCYYDQEVIDWLKDEGFELEEVDISLKVSWD